MRLKATKMSYLLLTIQLYIKHQTLKQRINVQFPQFSIILEYYPNSKCHTQKANQYLYLFNTYLQIQFDKVVNEMFKFLMKTPKFTQFDYIFLIAFAFDYILENFPIKPKCVDTSTTNSSYQKQHNKLKIYIYQIAYNNHIFRYLTNQNFKVNNVFLTTQQRKKQTQQQHKICHQFNKPNRDDFPKTLTLKNAALLKEKKMQNCQLLLVKKMNQKSFNLKKKKYFFHLVQQIYMQHHDTRQIKITILNYNDFKF
eukprot:TRINITY_DN7470_c0_g1_i1.p2 TRINITY_DN7470_c0_g1~~TRINITY_DN7470_c0_g1_i1.p2  ORF type:complete len:254 (-),score=-19.64 TRINITY_DN7470_c0_g1_i1:489-1250(-)